MKRLVSTSLTASSRTLVDSLPFLIIAPRTARHGLHEKFNFRAATRTDKRDLINATNRKDRLEFCHWVKDWTPEMWEQALWSSETTGRQYGNQGFTIVSWNTRRTSELPSHMKRSPSVMVWESLRATGQGGVFCGSFL